MSAVGPSKQRRQAQQFYANEYKAKILALCCLACCAVLSVVWEFFWAIDYRHERNTTSYTTTSTTHVSDGNEAQQSLSPSAKRFMVPENVDVEIANFVEGTVPDNLWNSSDAAFNPLQNCSVTSQVQVILPDSRDSSSTPPQPWILQSLDRLGRAKTVGGDEFYVTYHADGNDDDDDNTVPPPPTAVALITDRLDGTYELDFVEPPPLAASTVPQTVASTTSSNERFLSHSNPQEFGRLTVYFLYSCGLGQAYKPQKDDWKFGGNTQIHHNIRVPRPDIRPFVPPQSGVDLETFDTIVFHGDSLIRQFSIYFREWGNKPDEVRGTETTKHSYRKNASMFLARATIDAWLKLLEEWHGDMLRRMNNVALITGSSAWDITKGNHQGPHFEDHTAAVRKLVRTVRNRYPKVTLLWKLPSALVRECGGVCVHAVRNATSDVFLNVCAHTQKDCLVSLAASAQGQ
jgi:hypothetical protein